MANGVAEASWLRQLLLELHQPLRRNTLIYCDNVSDMYLSTNPVQHQRTKHVEIDLHFIRERVAVGDIRVLHVPTTYVCFLSCPVSNSAAPEVQTAGGVRVCVIRPIKAHVTTIYTLLGLP